MDKDQVAEVLEHIGVLLELKGENPFKSRAYAQAARTLSGLTEPLEKIIAENRLGTLPGIGQGLQEKITELAASGRLAYYEELQASIPPGLITLLEISGLGPKKIRALHARLGIAGVDELEAACRSGRVAALDGFGEKSQGKILEGIEFRRQYASRHLLVDALAAADPILAALRSHPDVIRCSPAGSVRRGKEIIGDLDFLASSKSPAAVIDSFARLPGIERVIARGETKASIILYGGMQADLRVVSDLEYPFALAYFTGSKEHNIVMRQRAISRGLRLNEYGLFRSVEETRDPALRVACRTEEDIFAQLGLAYVPPELREDQGEFAAAEQGKIPRLIEWTDLKGSLHNHSNWSDGQGSIEEIAAYMQELGCAYWAITDHSRSSFQAGGLDSSRLRKQLREIGQVNQRLADSGADFRLLTGAEVDILGDGRLDFPDDVLAELDVVVASLHAGFSQNGAEMTRRLIRAAENPFVHILGHPTGRLLLEREPYPLDETAVIDACAATGTWIELNAHPCRFDLDWRLWPYAKKQGVRCAINCDAHRLEHAGFLRLGAGIARKGWLTRNDVVNSLPWPKLSALLAAKRAR
ncbi:MAG: DNA polymerase/3'-5' exonuclease PolX [Verrucomicrobia bacterium]|nr:DNA polymerase/3'-5' exonuclease PolX [Verrucomicrobiota bacterium]